jgi:hypothetical protein
MITGGLDLGSDDTWLGLLFIGELVPLTGTAGRTVGFADAFEEAGFPALGLLLSAGEWSVKVGLNVATLCMLVDSSLGLLLLVGKLVDFGAVIEEVIGLFVLGSDVSNGFNVGILVGFCKITGTNVNSPVT